jgi:DNA-binding transcriptional regulator GbsR (MarR family)
MPITNYRRALFDANQDLARCLEQRQKIDHKVARLQAVVSQLQDLCAELDQKHFARRVERVVKADLTMGITELARVILKETSLPMTASDLKERMQARKLDLSRYSNPMAVIHTVLKRLVQSGEAKVVPQKQGKKAYQWLSTTDKLLSELRQSSQPAAQQRDGSKEPK